MSISETLSRAAEIIAPYISSDFRRLERARGAADDLDHAGLLVGSRTQPSGTLPPVGQATNLLQCRFSWADAEAIAVDLDTANLLRKDA